MPDLVELGSVIRTARKGLRLTQSDLARKSGVSRARIDATVNELKEEKALVSELLPK